MRDFGEMAVAVVVIHEHGDGLKDIGMAIAAITFAMLAAPHILPVPGDVAIYNQVEQTVVIQVHPGRRSGPATAPHACLVRHVGESAVAVVVIKTVAAIAGDEEILVAVVVVIGNRNAHAVADSLQTRLLSDVLERSIGLLVVHAIPVFGPGLLWNEALRSRIGIGCAVDQEEIETAVVIAVEQGNAGAHRLNQVFARGVRRLMQEVHSRLLRNIDKSPGDRKRRHGLLCRRLRAGLRRLSPHRRISDTEP